MKNPADMTAEEGDWHVVITKSPSPADLLIQISLLRKDEEGDVDLGEHGIFSKVLGQDGTSARIEIESASGLYDEESDCDNAYMVVLSSAPKKYGPMLYDIALELAGAKGLVPDVVHVSATAHGIWDYYLNRREDVQTVEMDPDDPRCESTIDRPWSGPEDGPAQDNWKSSPLTKIYYKKDKKTIASLKRLNKLIYRHGEIL